MSGLSAAIVRLGPGHALILIRQLLLALLLALLAAPSAAGAAVVLTDPTAEVQVRSPELRILEDPTGDLTIDDVTTPPHAGRFAPSARAVPNPGFSSSAFWARFTVRNGTGEPAHWRLVLANPRIDRVDFYVSEPGGGFLHQRSGRLEPFVSRDGAYRHFLLDLPMAQGEERHILVRIAGKRELGLPLILRSAEALAASVQGEYWWLGLYYGLLLAMLGYNLLLFLSLREASYFHLALMLGGLILYRLDYDGLLTQLFLPDAPPRYLGMPLGVCLALAALSQFSILFLRTAERARRVHLLLRLIQVAALALMAGLMVLPGLLPLGAVLAAIELPVVMVAAFLSWHRGFAPARFFLLAGVAVFLTYFVLSLMNLGVIGVSLWIEQAGHVTAVIGALLFSLAQFERIDLLRREAVRANAALRESERRLEGQVAARTADLVQARDRAEAASRAKSELLANVSHELRTPLNAVLGFASLLRGRERSPDKLATLGAIESAGKTLLRLIDDILDLSKVEAGILDLRLGPVDLPALLKELEAMYARPSAQKGLHLRTLVDPAVPRFLELDEVRVRQVLANLLGNAVKFTERGEIELGARADPRGEDEVALNIWVRDTGIGIASERQSEIFEPFTRVDATGGGGAGLGLTVCRRLARLMGGEIDVDSAPGRGSTFTLRLPGIRPAAESASPPPAPGEAPLRDFAPARILIADDEPLNRRLLHAYLAEGPFDLLEAADGGQALEIARREHPDLVLLDMVMPVMDGISVARALQADAATRDTAIVAVTADAVSPRGALAAQVCDVVLTKPLSKATLVAAMGRVLPRIIGAEDRSAPAGGDADEEPRRDLLGAALAAEAAYRTGLASRLHETPLQTLAAAQIGAEMAVADPLAEGQAEVAGLIGRAIRELRALLFDLSFDRLLDEGLDGALDSLAWHLEGSLGVPFAYHRDRRPELPRPAASLLLQSLLELVRGGENLSGGVIEVRHLGAELVVALSLDGGGARRADASAIAARMDLAGCIMSTEGRESGARIVFRCPGPPISNSDGVRLKGDRE